jgi:hypothetical protein
MPNTLIPIYAYVVCASSGVLLFDTGLGPSHPFIDEAYHPRRWLLAELLSRA